MSTLEKCSLRIRIIRRRNIFLHSNDNYVPRCRMKMVRGRRYKLVDFILCAHDKYSIQKNSTAYECTSVILPLSSNA